MEMSFFALFFKHKLNYGNTVQKKQNLNILAAHKQAVNLIAMK